MVVLIPNTSAALPLPAGSATPSTNILRPGNYIYAVSKGIFKLGVYFVKHQERVSRDIAPSYIIISVLIGI